MTELFDQQQLSAGVREFERHLSRASVSDWTVDCQLAKPLNAEPAQAAAGNRRGAVPNRGKSPPIGLSSEKSTSRRPLVAFWALALTIFVGVTAATFLDWSVLFGQKDSAAIKPEPQAIAAAAADDAAQSVGSASSAAPSKAPPRGLATAPATSEVYTTIRPDGSLAPETTPRGALVRAADPMPQAVVAPPPVSVPAPASDLPAPDSTTAPTAAQTQPAPAVATTSDAPVQKDPPAAKPAKKRTATQAANPAAKPIAAKPAFAKPVAEPSAAATRPSATAAVKPADEARRPAPAAANDDGILQSAQQAVGSLTGAVKKLVGAD